jgi:hypothetical protein
MKKPFVVTDKDGNKIYDSDLVQEAIEKLGKNITYKNLLEERVQVDLKG